MGYGKTDANSAKGVGSILGAIADLKLDNKLLRAENASLWEANASLREASAANAQEIGDLAAMIGRLAPLPHHGQSPRPRAQTGWAAPAMPRATPCIEWGSQTENGPDRPTSPPATPRKPKVVRIASHPQR